MRKGDGKPGICILEQDGPSDILSLKVNRENAEDKGTDGYVEDSQQGVR